MSIERDRAVRRICLVAIVGALLFAPVAGAAASATPRGALSAAQKSMATLAGQASSNSVRGWATDAATALAGATAPALWIDARDAVAPPYGAQVFANSIAAAGDLEALGRFSVAQSRVVLKLVLGADRDLAERVISQASAARRPSRATARRALAAGNGDLAARHYTAAARSFAQAWEDGYRALTGLVASTLTTAPASSVSAAAEQALGSRKIGLAGPLIRRDLPPLTRRGKPELLFIGAEGCPFCAVQRWGMILALSQFGTFSNLHLMQSDTTDTPVVRTFTFLGSSYSSPYISFVSREVLSNVRRGRKYQHLQPLDGAQRALFDRFDGQAETPFIDVANRFISVSSTVQPPLLRGLSWTQIAGSLTRPASIPAQTIAGVAEVMTAELCTATGGKPQTVCSAPAVGHYQAALPMLNGRGGGCPVASTTRAGMSLERRPSPPAAQPAKCHTY